MGFESLLFEIRFDGAHDSVKNAFDGFPAVRLSETVATGIVDYQSGEYSLEDSAQAVEAEGVRMVCVLLVVG